MSAKVHSASGLPETDFHLGDLFVGNPAGTVILLYNMRHVQHHSAQLNLL
jgi:hypothetical protein